MKPLQLDWLFKQTGIRVTEQPLDHYPSAELRQRIEEIYNRLSALPQTTIEPLQQLIAEYPHFPELKNYLYLAYSRTGQTALADRILQETREAHPDYIFGFSNQITAETDPKKLAALAEPRGLPLDIRSFPSTREDGAYHISEFVAIEQAAMHYEAYRGNIKAAIARLDRLLELGIAEDKLRESARTISRAKLENFSHRQQKRQAQTIHSPDRSSFPSTDRRELPELVHDELYGWYNLSPDDVNQAAIDEALALPRATTITDMRAILRDTIDRYDFFRKGLADELIGDFHFCALDWLAIFGAEDALEDILDQLRMDQQFIDYWYGDYLEDQFIPVLFTLGKERVATLFDYLYEPYNPALSRVAVAQTLVQIGLQVPGQRESVVTGFQRLLDYYLATTPLPEGLLDTNFLTFVIGYSADLREERLIPAYRKIAARGWLIEDIFGDIERIAVEVQQPADPGNVRALPETPLEYFDGSYRERQAPTRFPELTELGNSPAEEMVFDHTLELLSNGMGAKTTTPKQKRPHQIGKKVDPRKQPKVGRNAPCPCGSGKKYKHCCLRK